MRTRMTAAAFAITTIALGILGCGPPKISITTVQNTSSASGMPATMSPMPEIEVWGAVVNPPYSSGGSIGYFDAFTNNAGVYVVNNPIVPADWNLQVFEPTWCSTLAVPPTYYVGIMNGYELFEVDSVAMENNDTWIWYCNAPLSQTPAATSRFAIAGNIPASVTLTGIEPFSSTYGMPVLYMYDGTNGNPNLAATITASSVGPAGASATFPLPSSLESNAYSLVTTTATPNGTYVENGFNFYSIASSQVIAGNPFGVSVGAMTDAYDGRQLIFPNPGPPQGVWQALVGQRYITFPVVSLYSDNQVLVNGTAVGVGANPTAVVTYPSGTVTTPMSTPGQEVVGTNTFTGNTRAIVTNSGGNTVSILDIVNDALLYNVTVGNQPVALAVSANGSTAYVANYTDSTVTQVNLNSGTAIATVAVGGQPTSVVLTAAGTLWVGGAGFLTQMSTQPLAVVSTVPTAGKKIVALGFSDSVNQLVATTIDTPGNVYIDEINPGSVQAGGTYSPLASNTVSSLGTHLDPVTQKQVLAFTGTLAGAALINTNQVGAQPLVVQDGWAVVTATPTGFSITDITGHDVLVSETTPSPVTAIAVDSQLNVVYLALPDSNVLLTVPLPGVSSPPPSFVVTATNNNPTQTALSLGHSMTYTINVAASQGFSGAVTLSASGLPAGVTANFSPASISTSGNATLTLTAAYNNSTYIGISTVTVTGTSGGFANSAAFILTTQPCSTRANAVFNRGVWRRSLR